MTVVEEQTKGVTMQIARQSIGRIAERIVMNELEARGYRVTDLNKDGLSANADLLAAKGGRVWQIQVKGATNNNPKERWWVQLGHCTQEMIDGRESVFNRRHSFYTAQYVILVAVRSPKVYRCIVLPVARAEEIAQRTLDYGYRHPGRNGGVLQPGKLWLELELSLRPRVQEPLRKKERELLLEFLLKWEDKWDLNG